MSLEIIHGLAAKEIPVAEAMMMGDTRSLCFATPPDDRDGM
jgi:hypothetical protein